MIRAERLTSGRPGRGLFSERGHALLAVLILTFIMSVVGMAFYNMAGLESGQAQYQRDYNQAFWAAETGLDRAVVHLSSFKQPPTVQISPFPNARIGNATYDVTVIPDPGNMFRVEKLFTIRSVGRARRASRQIDEVVRMEGFSRYGYFTEEEVGLNNENIWFFSGDDVGGRTHTNGVFHIKGNPRFRGEVTTAADHMVGHVNMIVRDQSGWPAGGNNPQFDQGFEMSVKPIELPHDTGDLRKAAQNGGLDLAGNYELHFGRTQPGEVSYRKTGDPTWTDVLVQSISNGVIHVQGSAKLQGVLDGMVTVGASQNVEIVGDMRYASADPVTGQPQPGADDIMGIVSGRNVIVRNVPETLGDLVIDATIMTLNTSFMAEGNSTGGPRGVIHMWGGLVQKRRGPVGLTHGATLLHGYTKDYHYDERVSAQPPPEFPLTGVYTRISWTEKAVSS